MLIDQLESRILFSNFLGMNDPVVANLTQNLASDGSISRTDMIQIFNTVASEGPAVSSADFQDLTTIYNNAASLNMPDYVKVLSGDVIKGNVANAQFQGQPLGNLASGSSVSVLNDLVSKWFYGSDVPVAYSPSTNTTWAYEPYSGTLYGANGPVYTDGNQGNLGDCFFVSGVGSVDKSNPVAIQNMILDNGDGTWTVRFYGANGVADYVTVNNELPVNSSGGAVYQGVGGGTYTDPGNVLWFALLEKAYVQWNETGKEGRNGLNQYLELNSGWGTADLYSQVLGHTATQYSLASGNKQTLINAVENGQAVTIATSGGSSLIDDHTYIVTSYNKNTNKFSFYNPWGYAASVHLTYDNLGTGHFVVAKIGNTVPIMSSAKVAGAATLNTVSSIFSNQPVTESDVLA